MINVSNVRLVEGFVLIKDKTTGEILLDKKNAVHYGNLSNAIANALIGEVGAQVRFMVFGNGGTSITGAGLVQYNTPNTGLQFDDAAALYNTTFFKDLSVDTPENNVTVIETTTNYTDIICTCTLSFSEPSSQDAVDNTTDNNGDFVFDEIALYNGTSAGTPDPLTFTPDGLLLTHIVFHPIQKSLNRILEIVYTLRIQMS